MSWPRVTAGKYTCELIELQGERNSKEEELIANRN
jgi:hypothetical protein